MGFKVKEIELKDVGKNSKIISEIIDGDCTGVVIKNFFSHSDVEFLLETKRRFKGELISPSIGYNALPRPFGGVLGEDNITEGYLSEIEYFFSKDRVISFQEKFKTLLLKIECQYKVLLANEEQNFSYSKTWFSIRELQPKLGSFEIHCGNYFIDWNRKFFNRHDSRWDENFHLAFLSVLQFAESKEDLVIYDAKWDEFVKVNRGVSLERSDGSRKDIMAIPKFKIKLSPRDVVVFNESDYWHSVGKFEGFTNRVSFGGFMSVSRQRKEIFLWA